jgi:hypothetical protein
MLLGDSVKGFIFSALGVVRDVLLEMHDSIDDTISARPTVC